MVKKLIKHEISSTFKYFTPVFIMAIVGSILFTILTNVSLRQDTISDAFGLVIGFVVLILVGLVVASIVLAIMGLLQVTYKTLYSLTGYRQFTYPITSSQRIIVKLVTSLFWIMVTSIFVFIMFTLSILVTYLINEPVANLFEYVYYVLRQVLTGFDFVLLSVLSVNSLSEMVLQITTILFAGAVANSSMVRKNRAIIAFVVYFVSVLVFSNITSLISMLIFNYGGTGILGIISSGDSIISYESLSLTIVLNLIFVALTTYGTIWFWDNKLEILN